MCSAAYGEKRSGEEGVAGEREFAGFMLALAVLKAAGSLSRSSGCGCRVVMLGRGAELTERFGLGARRPCLSA